MKVRTLVAHMNGHPPAAEKKKGDVYDVPDSTAEALIADGTVEAFTEEKAATARGKG